MPIVQGKLASYRRELRRCIAELTKDNASTLEVGCETRAQSALLLADVALTAFRGGRLTPRTDVEKAILISYMRSELSEIERQAGS